ncbi:MAG TPA: VOC family protein [Thermoleophilaceae bacterium]|jgi:catechol 2,3-dioxygenase-like lactoylglutathione lyase family enzyme|nr:VOC family protein [Thermoleophilaceae bacterium]
MRFDGLDFIYMPSRDPAAELDWFEETLGAEVVFAIERFGTRVAMLQPATGPAILLAGHLEGERPILVFRVESLNEAAAELEAAGASVSEEFGIPHGPIREIEAPGGHRLAIYELTRPETAEHLKGRRDW